MNEIANQQMCVLIRGNIEIWVSKARGAKIKELMESQKYIEIDGSTIATFDITGIVTPEHMEEKTRRANGEYKCLKGTWHDKFEKCGCRELVKKAKGFVKGIGEVTIPVYK
jgi:hypothetical protein